MTDDTILAIQTAIFGLAVWARIHMGSSLSRKRTHGFLASACCGILLGILFYSTDLLVLAAMEAVMVTIDSRSAFNNWMKGDIIPREEDE